MTSAYGYLAFAGDLRIGHQMPRLAMHRDRHPRSNHLIHANELVACRMTGHVNEMIMLGNDLDAKLRQCVL